VMTSRRLIMRHKPKHLDPSSENNITFLPDCLGGWKRSETAGCHRNPNVSCGVMGGSSAEGRRVSAAFSIADDFLFVLLSRHRIGYER
jgi:hypothetical protein